MAQETKKIPYQSPKYYFVYFIIFSIIVLIIFSFIIVGYSWDFWSLTRNMEKYYKGKLTELNQIFPQVNQFDPIKGQPDAKVTIFEYSDFVCPNCQDTRTDLTALEKFYGTELRFVFKGLPITGQLEARPALLAAYCAQEQNKFWEYQDLLWQNPALLSQQLHLQYANQLKLNLDQFNQCINSQKYNQVIYQNMTDALSLQINSLPTVYVNDQKVEGYFNYNTLKNIIDQKLK